MAEPEEETIIPLEEEEVVPYWKEHAEYEFYSLLKEVDGMSVANAFRTIAQSTEFMMADVMRAKEPSAKQCVELLNKTMVNPAVASLIPPLAKSQQYHDYILEPAKQTVLIWKTKCDKTEYYDEVFPAVFFWFGRPEQVETIET